MIPIVVSSPLGPAAAQQAALDAQATAAQQTQSQAQSTGSSQSTTPKTVYITCPLCAPRSPLTEAVTTSTANTSASFVSQSPCQLRRSSQPQSSHSRQSSSSQGQHLHPIGPRHQHHPSLQHYSSDPGPQRIQSDTSTLPISRPSSAFSITVPLTLPPHLFSALTSPNLTLVIEEKIHPPDSEVPVLDTPLNEATPDDNDPRTDEQVADEWVTWDVTDE